MLNRSRSLIALGLVLSLAAVAEAGPPLICHAFDAGTASLLPWSEGQGWNNPDRAYDVWHDRALFHFLTEPAERSRYVEALRAATHAGSFVIIAAFALDGPEQCSGLPVRRYDAEAMATELGEDFELIEDWRQAHVTPWGASQSFQWGAFRRA